MTPPAPRPASSSFFAEPYHGVLGALHEAVVVIDETQAVVALNPAAERLFDSPAGEVLGQSIGRFIPLPWRESHLQRVREFAAAEKPTPRAMAAGRRVPVLRPDGSTRPVEIMLSRFEMADGGPRRIYYAALMRDVADERNLEEQLASFQKLMLTVFELSPTAIWICEDEHLVYTNRAAARLFGVPTIDALLGRPLAALLDEPSHAALRAQVDRVLAEQEAGASVSGRLLRSDGEAREVEIVLAALPDAGRRTVQMVVNDVTMQRREAAELERSRRELRDLSASVVEAREEERRRISRELHDELGQRLTALKIDLSNLASETGVAAGEPRVAAMVAMIDDTLASVRRIASDLRPMMLDDLGLTAAIDWLARDASRRIGIPVHARLPQAEPVVDQRVAIALYRMVQEALTNVARHAQASRVDIELRVQGPSLVLTVTDDGIGVPDQTPRRDGAFGLIGLRERAQMLGGEVTVGRRTAGGTRLVVRVPARPAAKAAV